MMENHQELLRRYQIVIKERDDLKEENAMLRDHIGYYERKIKELEAEQFPMFRNVDREIHKP